MTKVMNRKNFGRRYPLTTVGSQLSGMGYQQPEMGCRAGFATLADDHLPSIAIGERTFNSCQRQQNSASGLQVPKSLGHIITPFLLAGRTHFRFLR
jgi:hypothetical protein